MSNSFPVDEVQISNTASVAAGVISLVPGLNMTGFGALLISTRSVVGWIQLVLFITVMVIMMVASQYIHVVRSELTNGITIITDDAWYDYSLVLGIMWMVQIILVIVAALYVWLSIKKSNALG
jgi:hypothetical protein